MKLKEDFFNYNYRNGRVASVEKNGCLSLEVQSNERTGEVTGITLPSTRETISLAVSGDRPIVESIGGRNVVSRIEKTLGEETPASARASETFEQTVNSDMNPTIKLADTLIVWNPATKKILKDGEWIYNIKPGSGPFDNAAIARKNSQGQREFWHYNVARGEETVLQADGIKKTARWFTSGILAGQPRTVAYSVNDSLVQFAKYSYNEQGILIRYQDDAFDCNVDPEANVLSITKNDTIIQENTLGKPVSIVRSKTGKTLIVNLAKQFGGTRQIFVPSLEDSAYDKLITFTKTHN